MFYKYLGTAWTASSSCAGLGTSCVSSELATAASKTRHSDGTIPWPVSMGTADLPGATFETAVPLASETWGRKPHRAKYRLGLAKLPPCAHVVAATANWIWFDRELILSSIAIKLAHVVTDTQRTGSALEANCLPIVAPV